MRMTRSIANGIHARWVATRLYIFNALVVLTTILAQCGKTSSTTQPGSDENQLLHNDGSKTSRAIPTIAAIINPSSAHPIKPKDEPRIILAAIWVLFTIIFQELMIRHEAMGANAGFIQLIGGIGENLFIFDEQWLQAYTELRRGMQGSTVKIHPASHLERRSGFAPGRWLWFMQTVSDTGEWLGISIWLRKWFRSTNTTGAQEPSEEIEVNEVGSNDAAISRPAGRQSEGRGSGPSKAKTDRVLSIHVIQLWWRSYRVFSRAATILEWKMKYRFRKAKDSDAESAENRGPRYYRLSDDMAVQQYRLDTKNEHRRQELGHLIKDPYQMLMIYGLSVIEIPKGNCRPQDPEGFQAAETFTIATLLILAVLGVMIKSREFGYGFFLLPILLVCHWKGNGQNSEQKIFCEEVGNRISQIEAAAKFLADEYSRPGPKPNRPIDILLSYKGVNAWCRCQPPRLQDPLDERDKTWVELMIPTTTPFINRIYGFIYHLVRSIVPWGHSNHWKINIIFAGLTIVFTALYGLWSGVFSLLAPWVMKWMLPDTALGDGENWTVAWYLLVFQWLTDKAASPVVMSVKDALGRILYPLLGQPGTANSIIPFNVTI